MSDVKFPVETMCEDCLYNRDSGDWIDGQECNCDDSTTYFTIDATGEHVSPREVNDTANAMANELVALRAERDRLAEKTSELDNVVSALSLGWHLVDKWHREIVHLITSGGSLEKIREFGIMEYPTLQGLRNQFAVEAIGKRPFDGEKATAFILAMYEELQRNKPTTKDGDL